MRGGSGKTRRQLDRRRFATAAPRARTGKGTAARQGRHGGSLPERGIGGSLRLFAPPMPTADSTTTPMHEQAFAFGLAGGSGWNWLQFPRGGTFVEAESRGLVCAVDVRTIQACLYFVIVLASEPAANAWRSARGCVRRGRRGWPSRPDSRVPGTTPPALEAGLVWASQSPRPGKLGISELETHSTTRAFVHVHAAINGSPRYVYKCQTIFKRQRRQHTLALPPFVHRTEQSAPSAACTAWDDRPRPQQASFRPASPNVPRGPETKEDRQHASPLSHHGTDRLRAPLRAHSAAVRAISARARWVPWPVSAACTRAYIPVALS